MSTFVPTLHELTMLGIDTRLYKVADRTSAADNLEAMVTGPIRIGVVNGINDGGEREAVGPELSVEQLEQLALFYLKERAKIRLAWEHEGTSGSYEIRMLPYASRRLVAIEDALGRAVVR